MLAVPVKKAKPVDWNGPLRTYISSSYPSGTDDDHQVSLQRINSTRARFITLTRGDDESIALAKSYLKMLGNVEARFPVDEQHIRMNFTWYDCFKPTKKFTHHRMRAERANALFNYASLESNAGMVTDRSNNEGLKKANTHFLTAASVYTLLRDKIVANGAAGPITSDLSYDGLSMLINLMLAQAQACFLEKAIRDKLKPGVLSMVGKQASVYYEEALKSALQPGIKEVLDKSWMTHFKYQSLCMQASSEFQHSKLVFQQAEKTGEGYGMSIAWLNSSMNKCNQAIDLAERGGLPKAIVAPIQALFTVCAKAQRKAVEDNNLIYMDGIPSKVGTFEGRSLARVSPVAEELWNPIPPGREDEDGVFRGLAPAGMQSAEKMFQDKLRAMVESSKVSVHGAEKTVRTRLAELNLPAAVEAGDMTSKGLPDQTWARILALVQEKGGIQSLRKSLTENSRAATAISDTLSTALGKLRDEENKDIRNRQTWGDKWNIQPAKEAHAHFYKDASRYQGLLAEARSSDRKLEDKINNKSKLLDTVSMPKEGLDLLIPDPSQVDDDPKVEALRTSLATYLVELETCLAELRTTFENFELSALKESIVPALSSHDDWHSIVKDSGALEAITDEEVRRYEGRIDKLNRLVESATVSLLGRIMEKNHAFMASRMQSDGTRQRQEVIQQIEEGINSFESFTRHIQDGKDFYANLTNLVSNFSAAVSDDVFARSLMSQDLEAQNATAAQNNAAQNMGITRQKSIPMLSRQNSTPLFSDNSGARTLGRGGFSAAPADQTQYREEKWQISAMFPDASDTNIMNALKQSKGNVEVAINHLLNNGQV